MKELHEMYKGSFFSRRGKLSWRVPYVCKAINKVFSPSSLIDVGCGIGDYVLGFKEMGIEARGIEGSVCCLPYLAVPKGLVFIEDIRKILFTVEKGYDLCLCLEVMEHVEKEFADNVVFNLVELSNKILLSAAAPGAGGHYHVNCQEKIYWEDKFASRGFYRNHDVEEKIKLEWRCVKRKKEMSAYYNYLIFFEKKGKKMEDQSPFKSISKAINR